MKSQVFEAADILCSKKQFVGYVAMWAIRQSSYPLSDLSSVLDKLSNSTEKEFEDAQFGVLEFRDFRSLEDFVKSHLFRVLKLLACIDVYDMDDLCHNIAMSITEEYIRDTP